MYAILGAWCEGSFVFLSVGMQSHAAVLEVGFLFLINT